VWALEAAYQPGRRSLFEGTPTRLLTVLTLALVVAAFAATVGLVPEIMVRVCGVAVGHGALLGVALAWARSHVGAGRGLETEEALDVPPAPSAAALPAGVLVVAASTAAFHPLGALVYLLVPVLVWRLGRYSLVTLGPGEPALRPRAAVLGTLTGLALGAHLLVTASQTLGYHVRLGDPLVLLGALGYDVGANALSAECFFRGALFRRLERRGPLRLALGASTVASVLRYLVDPLLPKTVEMAMGAALYLAVLGAANCWLLRWSGSLVPGYIAALGFFAAYRMLEAR
jgi:Type II CAAX prenyl endopeptidase Rce1-like